MLVRRAVAVFLALHGVVHVIGFLGSWRLAEFEGAPYTTAILNGMIDAGDAGIRFVGIAWLAIAVAFVLVAAAVWRGRPGAWRPTAIVAATSLAICAVGLPAAVIGAAIDGLILAAIGATRLIPAPDHRGVTA